MRKIVSILISVSLLLPALTIAAADSPNGNRLSIEARFYDVTDGDSYTLSIPSDADKTVQIIAASFKQGILSAADIIPLELKAHNAEYHINAPHEYDTLSIFMSDGEIVSDVPFFRDNRIFTFDKNRGMQIECDVLIKNNSDNDENAAVEYKLNSSPLCTNTLTVPAKSEIVRKYTISTDISSSNNISVTVADSSGMTYDGGFLTCSDVSFPAYSPLETESNDTHTFGAHDPSVFKDPISGKYYAYSSHNLIFVSDNLIDWTKYDFTANPTNNTGITITVPESSAEFVKTHYPDTAVNGTYWAPDILYMADSEYPYWFYTSVSCGLGGRNSVIDLVKSKSPLIWDGEYMDCGVVLASKEMKGFYTNAIDGNIYTDTDGIRYFIWGSFWQGIHAARLNDNGTIKGIDAAASGDGSDKSIKNISGEKMLELSTEFGTRLYSTPSGVFGPEGPWMTYNPDSGNRYMITSYGWLGTNYNIRIARTNKTMKETLASKNPEQQFIDHNGNPVGSAYSAQEDKSVLWGYKLLGSYQLGDGIVYMGNGHCSVLHDNDSWYLIEHCRKIPDATAYLQVRKMLWTKDGWPVVSPMVYSGEAEQKIPEELLWGTYDLSSVGHTIFADGVYDVSSCSSSSADLPVLSSQIVLFPDGSLGDNLGTWSFDNDHTVTIHFTADGDAEDYEFYKNGDTMTMFVLTGYDKDKRENAVVMTGVDENNITQFAKKADNSLDSVKSVYAVSSPAAEVTKNKSVSIQNSTGMIAHPPFTDAAADSAQPVKKSLIFTGSVIDPNDAAWEFVDAKYVPSGENPASYVSIQSANKQGLYIKLSNSGIILTEEAEDISARKRLSFKTVAALNGDSNSVSFESAAKAGQYISVSDGKIIASDGTDKNACSFAVTDIPRADTSVNIDNYTSKFEFENNLTDSVTGFSGCTTGALCPLPPSSESAVFAEGHNGNAVSFTGTGSDGVNLGNIVNKNVYTISFWYKANTITRHTAAIFLNSTVGGGQNWVSAPFGNRSTGIINIWSHNASGYINYTPDITINAGEWHQLTISVIGSGVYLYIDGNAAGLGEIADIADSSTNLYLAVNEWDTPFDGYIDDLYVYNGRALSSDEAKALYDATM